MYMYIYIQYHTVYMLQYTYIEELYTYIVCIDICSIYARNCMESPPFDENDVNELSAFVWIEY